jgi:hypothetical protein
MFAKLLEARIEGPEATCELSRAETLLGTALYVADEMEFLICNVSVELVDDKIGS